MGMTKGLGALEVYVNSDEGAAFITDNNMFISCDGDFNSGIVYTLDQKNHSCKFLVTRVPSGKILLQDYRGLYLRASLPTGVHFVEPESPAADSLREFEPYFEGVKVAFKAGNGMFLCRVFHRFHYIEASRPNPDSCCRFHLVLGDMLYPNFDITQLSIGTLSNVKLQPYVMKKDQVVNRSTEAKEHTFKFNWEVRTVETTTWRRPWGMDCKASYLFNLLGIEGTVTYDGTHNKVITTRRIIREEKSATVTVLPNQKATAQLIVSKQDVAEIPFMATIKKLRADGTSIVIYEQGKWKGLAYDAVTLQVKQEELKDETNCAVL